MSPVNANRLRTMRVISLFPGIHLRMLQRLTKTSFNTTRYHVRNLERAGEIVCSKEGGHERLYPKGLPEDDRAMSALLLDGTTRRIIEALLSSGPMCNGEICVAVKLPKSTVSEHVDRMRKAGVVSRLVKQDGTVCYDLREKEEAALSLASFRVNLLSVAADRFADLWDL